MISLAILNSIQRCSYLGYSCLGNVQRSLITPLQVLCREPFRAGFRPESKGRAKSLGGNEETAGPFLFSDRV